MLGRGRDTEEMEEVVGGEYDQYILYLYMKLLICINIKNCSFGITIGYFTFAALLNLTEWKLLSGF